MTPPRTNAIEGDAGHLLTGPPNRYRSSAPVHHHAPSQFQVITITGRLTTQPVTRSTQSGSTVTSLRVAIPRPRKDGTDQGADFVDVTVFGPQADSCATYLAKGRRIAVDGQLHHSEWDSDTGRRQKLEVIARNVEFLDRATDDPDHTTAPVPEVADAA